jgi:hypothetical protein
MDRRHVLTTIAGVGSLSGCLSDGSDRSVDQPDPNGSSGSNTDSDSGSDTGAGRCADPEPFTVGAPTADINPHAVTIKNSADERLSVHLTVGSADTETPLLKRSFCLAPGAQTGGVVREPGDYTVTISVGTGSAHETGVNYFDSCNEYGTTISITAPDSVTSKTMKTHVACRGQGQ